MTIIKYKAWDFEVDKTVWRKLTEFFLYPSKSVTYAKLIFAHSQLGTSHNLLKLSTTYRWLYWERTVFHYVPVAKSTRAHLIFSNELHTTLTH